MNENEIQIAYKQGFIDGLRCFAHWENGKQMVGTCGKTLQNAIEQIETLWNYNKNYEN